MALWNNTTKPKWLLPSGEGTNAVPNGDELALADDLPGIGWRIWHAKESGQALGVGRGWWEILATQDVTGGAVDSAGPVAGIVSAISLSAAGVAAITGGAPLAFTVSATDEDNQVITYTAVSAINCTATIVEATGVGSITAIADSTAVDGVYPATSITWKATANSVDTPDQTITITLTA